MNNVVTGNDVIRGTEHETSSCCVITCFNLKWRRRIIDLVGSGAGSDKE
jgi:hypothetical protein